MSKCNPITRIIPASFAWIILLFSTGVFFAFPCRYLMSVYSIAIPVFQSIVTFFVTVNFGLATFVNPGAIPKAAPDEYKNIVTSSTYQEIEIHGVRVRLKWCVTCQFYRPPRCVHCGICDTCIETFDHHCPWVNNCIGRRNYRYFFMFLLWLTIHMVSILSLCALYMKDHLNNIKQLETIMTMSIIGIIVFLFIPIFGLTGFHCMMITQGKTTNEQVTEKFVDIKNPYNKGCIKNIIYTLCNSPLPRYKTKYSFYDLIDQHSLKNTKELKSSEGSDVNNPDKYFGVQYQYVGKSEYSLSKQNDSFECDQTREPSFLNRGSLHLSLNEALCSRHPESTFKSKSSRALTPPVPTRLDYSRRSLPPHNKLHATTPGYFVPQGNVFPTQKNISRIGSDQSNMFYSRDHTPLQTETNYGAAASQAGNLHMYSHLHKSADGLLGERYTYGIQNTINNGKGLSSDSCCLGNQTVDKLQELANRSVISGQCTDMSVLEVFPNACSSFQTSPNKEMHDGQRLLIAQTPQPLYLSNYGDNQQGAGPNQCQNNMPIDFLRTPGNRPLSFVKAMEMSEALDWNEKNPQQLPHIGPTSQFSQSVHNPHFSGMSSESNKSGPEVRRQKSDHEISYEISV